MICKTCRNRIDDLDLYCRVCGEPSENHRNQFIIKDILKADTGQQTIPPPFYLFSIPATVALLTIIYIFNFSVITTSYWANYILLNICSTLIIPLIMLPFGIVINQELFKQYLRLLEFTFYMGLYFFALKVICQGDPILNLVRFIMVLWGVAVAFPVPTLIFSTTHSVLKIIGRAYIAGKYLRWKQFYLSLYCATCIFLSLLTLLIMLPKSLYFTARAMQKWHCQQQKYNLYDQPANY